MEISPMVNQMETHVFYQQHIEFSAFREQARFRHILLPIDTASHVNHTRRKQLSIPCVVLTSYALECRIISSR